MLFRRTIKLVYPVLVHVVDLFFITCRCFTFCKNLFSYSFTLINELIRARTKFQKLMCRLPDDYYATLSRRPCSIFLTGRGLPAEQPSCRFRRRGDSIFESPRRLNLQRPPFRHFRHTCMRQTPLLGHLLQLHPHRNQISFQEGDNRGECVDCQSSL